MAAVITYAYPVSGTVAPTAIQSSVVNTVTATVAFADADTTATVTHNFGFTTYAIGRLYPFVILDKIGDGTAPGFTVISKTSNTVVITKESTAVGSNGSFDIAIFKNSVLMPLVP